MIAQKFYTLRIFLTIKPLKNGRLFASIMHLMPKCYCFSHRLLQYVGRPRITLISYHSSFYEWFFFLWFFMIMDFEFCLSSILILMFGLLFRSHYSIAHYYTCSMMHHAHGILLSMAKLLSVLSDGWWSFKYSQWFTCCYFAFSFFVSMIFVTLLILLETWILQLLQ